MSRNYKQILSNLLNDESGQDLVEYALIGAIIALGAVVSMDSLANTIGNAFNNVGNNLSNAVT